MARRERYRRGDAAHGHTEHDHFLERRNDLVALIGVSSALAFAWLLGRSNGQACCNQLTLLQQQTGVLPPGP